MEKQKKQIKQWVILFMVVLFISGLTAIPVERELSILQRLFQDNNSISNWLQQVYNGFHDTNSRYPFLAYGYDWLAFAHFVLAILFIGPFKNPVKNKWVIEFGMIACVLIIPFALVAGHFRGIPFWWRLLDCSFGVFGLVPLIICYRKINNLEELITSENIQHEN